MKHRTAITGGWLRSKELTALAKPLAVLLLILFSMTIHVNTALAVGGENSICAATRVINSDGKNIPARQLQIEHCGICIVSFKYKSFGLQNPVAANETRMENKPVFFVSETQDILHFIRYAQIRAPPISKNTK